MFFKRERLRSISKLTNYSVSNFALIAYYFNIKMLIDVALQFLYCSNLFLALNLLIL